MLEYYTGVPGSGKTYRAVDHVYNCFLDDKHKDYGKYRRFFTNINEFHFDVFNVDPRTTTQSPKESVGATNESALGITKLLGSLISRPKSERNKDQSRATPPQEKKEVAFSLRMDDLMAHLEELRQLYLDKQPDSVLLDRAAALGISDSLFVIDEAHNYFDDKNETLIWWLSYHRHLHQDIILITQNLSLIYRKYLSFGEFFYRAVPSSLRLRSGVFTYHQFVKYQLFKNSHTDTIKVKFNPAVFSLYGSGANTQGKKVVYKFIAIGVVLAVIVTVGFKIFASSWSSTSDQNSTVKKSSFSPSPFVPVDRSKTFTAVCIGFECSLMGQTFTLNDFNNYVKTYSLQPVNTVISGEGILFRSFARNDKFFLEVLNVSPDSSAAR